MVSLRLPKQRVATVPAPLFRRFLAFVLDMLVLDLAVTGPFRRLFLGLFGGGSMADIQLIVESSRSLSLTVMALLLLLGILFLSYFAILEFTLGQTLGKRLFRLRVENDQKRKQPWQYVVRSMFVIPVFPFIILWVVDPIHMLFSMGGRRWTEKLSRTRVVQDVAI